MKSDIQKQQRRAYWQYIEDLILDIPVPDQGNLKHFKPPKILFSYIKTQKNESHTIPPIRENGILKSDPQSKSNILNRQFQNAFTPITNDHIPDKGPSPHPPMEHIYVTEKGKKKTASQS